MWFKRKPEPPIWTPEELKAMQNEIVAQRAVEEFTLTLSLTEEQIERIVRNILVRYPSTYRRPIEDTILSTMNAFYANAAHQKAVKDGE